jgi:hypothetical protein
MKKCSLLLATFLICCTSNKNFETVKYSGHNNSKRFDYVYRIHILKGFEIKEVHGGNEWIEKAFIYPDRATIYISNEPGNTSLNYKNIRNDEMQSDLSIRAFFSNDTITLKGKDKNGRFWKNVFDGNVNVGYLNVPKERMDEFDGFIKSILKS